MTIESCISFCDGQGFNYAGAEFSSMDALFSLDRVIQFSPIPVRGTTTISERFVSESDQSVYWNHCDSTIQVPGQPAALSDCNFGCSGNSTESCGSSGRMNLLYNGKPGPSLVPSVADGSWLLQGCYTDIINQRTLDVPVNIPSGVTAESCTAACQSLGGYTYAGMENGVECWCDNTINPPTQHVSDNDCRMVCSASHSQYCGNQNRIAVYRFTESGDPGGPKACLSTDVANFTLRAAYKNTPTNGPASVPLKIVLTELVPNIVWGVLSACSTCCSEWPYFSLQNSVFFPQSPSNPTLHASSIGPGDGESLSFVSSNPAFPGTQSYCTMEDTSAAVGSPAVLAFGGKTDAFSLCRNSTANDRLDVVFSPVTGHPHYSLDNCSPVTIQVIIG
ncbi:hypothetical protein Hypma_013560 [Hypsizygus marmoreus]|uniref:WSC domain-containing protein n=1 Tax=Hypsizygus marmoreus TaxID=39966 RepID=A0A369JFL3_HYPMA|nr:hypothetical protein Hypma_013560 [Hypsizygus marmoreus]